MNDWYVLGGIILCIVAFVALIFGIAALCTLFQDWRDRLSKKYLMDTLKPYFLDPDFGAYQYPLPPFPSDKVKRKLHKIYKSFSDRSMGSMIHAQALRYLPHSLAHDIQFGAK